MQVYSNDVHLKIRATVAYFGHALANYGVGSPSQPLEHRVNLRARLSRHYELSLQAIRQNCWHGPGFVQHKLK